MPKSIRFIDLFAGIGGIREGFEAACDELGIRSECVFTSEIKTSAINILRQNHPFEEIHGDITQISAKQIPKFDILLGGFPCQAFSVAGKRLGFEDTRGTLFFDVVRILQNKKPAGFILENVEGLVSHDKKNSTDKIGRTLHIILEQLNGLGYHVNWKILNSKDFGVPQNRKRIYIVGTKKHTPSLENFETKHQVLNDILEKGRETSQTEFVKNLLKYYDVTNLPGKSIKDKRGGNNNIHSWEIGHRGKVTKAEKDLLNKILTERRKKKWAVEYNIDWMDGMPLTINQIKTFYNHKNLEKMLDNLVNLGYLKYEYPKKKVGNRRVEDITLPMGYNITSGKMSFEVNKILDPNDVSPTLVAMDMEHIYVVDGKGIRTLTLREGLRLFGYPESFKFDISKNEGYDLLGNTVVVPVIKEVSKRVINAL